VKLPKEPDLVPKVPKVNSFADEAKPIQKIKPRKLVREETIIRPPFDVETEALERVVSDLSNLPAEDVMDAIGDRFDINNPGKDKPHFQLEKQDNNGDWIDAGDKHRYYFKGDK
jgi:hypothetical protein